MLCITVTSVLSQETPLVSENNDSIDSIFAMDKDLADHHTQKQEAYPGPT